MRPSLTALPKLTCLLSPRSALVGGLLAIGLLVAAPRPALAQQPAGGNAAAADSDDEVDEEEAAAKHFAQGRSLYAEGKYKEAIEELLKAFTLRPAPPILLNIGRTYEKLEDKPKALEYYRQFLQKARLVDPNRKMVEGLVKKLEQETGVRSADSAARTETPDAARTSDATPAHQAEQVIHTPVDSAKVRESITIQAELPSQVAADDVWVFYRKAGEQNFRRVQMTSQGDAYVARIPGNQVTSTSLQYYIEATKRGQRRALAQAGSRSAPHIVVIEGGRAPILRGTKIEIRSPYRTWFWVGAAGTLALFGGSVAMAVMAGDRASAVEVAAEKPEPFDARARNWESEGQTFATMGKLLLGVGIVAAGATGYLWYRDRKYVRQKRQEIFGANDGIKTVRFSGAPWASANGGGFVGRIDF